MRRLLAPVAVVVLALCGAAAPAAADAGSLLVDLPGDSVGFTNSPTAPVLEADHLAPGYSQSARLAIRNDAPSTARLDLSTFDVTDEERGCVRPETLVPGEGCDSDGGELSDWLRVAVTRDDATGTTLWSGAFSELSRGVKLTDALPARTTWPLRLTISMPWGATNDTMTDTVTFGTRLSASAQDGVSIVAGPPATVGSGVGGVTPQAAAGSSSGSSMVGALLGGRRATLPMTGSSISLGFLLLDLGVLLAGAALVWMGRRQRTTGPA